ncbi:MAG: response regulator transcription factor [Planctomycetales bacterium]|nr:response regulator transcription factor [Planctomycetales bacterium]
MTFPISDEVELAKRVQSQDTVFVVDDDPIISSVIQQMLEVGGFRCRNFTSSRALLSAFSADVSCVLTDLLMPDGDGSELMQQLHNIDGDLPIIVLTGHADVPTAVRLMEQGAVTIVEKPLQGPVLVAAVRKAIDRARNLRFRRDEAHQVRSRMAQLSDDEKEVMRELVAGAQNKTIATRLALSARTVDRRRRSVLNTMGVSSVPELATLLAKHHLT